MDILSYDMYSIFIGITKISLSQISYTRRYYYYEEDYIGFEQYFFFPLILYRFSHTRNIGQLDVESTH